VATNGLLAAVEMVRGRRSAWPTRAGALHSPIAVEAGTLRHPSGPAAAEAASWRQAGRCRLKRSRRGDLRMTWLAQNSPFGSR
jgi:hypothetical protein